MNYQNVYDYSKDISQNLGLSVKWIHAGKSNLNLINDINEGVTCWSIPFTSSGSTSPIISRTWTLQFIFYQQDTADSDMDQNDTSKQQESIRTLANTDYIAETFLRLFFSNDINDDLSHSSELLNITGYSTDVAIKDTAQLLTGTLLTITAQFPDNFDYCCVDNVT